MKKTINPLLIKLIISVFISAAVFSCKKDTKTPTPATKGKFTFKLDGGAAITVDSANALLYSTAAGRQMDVYAYKAGAEILEFHFDPKTGTKTAGTTLGAGAFLTYMESAVSSFDSQSGSLNVTVCDTVANKIEGDFSFVAKQYPYTGGSSKTISEGHMSVTKISK